ncbi:M23 family metallopeptidase [Sphingorhabdus sp.]|uniref:M23 family metallopeptidase n=1 Tax=Sphingorhabdus sp. TaxID=1902408 RepID=UPI0038FBFC85
MSSIKFFFLMILAMQVSMGASAKAAGRDPKHYGNSIPTDLDNDFGDIFLRWQEANESTIPPEENSFDRPSVGNNISGSELKRDATANASHHNAEFSQIFSIWQKQSALEISALTRMEPRRRGTDYSAPRMPHISSDFGWRRDPITKELRVHKGLDMPGVLGSPIYATANGVVREAKWRGSYGFLVEIQHSKIVRTRYAHLSRTNVAPGQRVRRNDIVGFMGSTGRSTGSHLHYEIYLNGIAVDPKPFLRAPN